MTGFRTAPQHHNSPVMCIEMKQKGFDGTGACVLSSQLRKPNLSGDWIIFIYILCIIIIPPCWRCP